MTDEEVWQVERSLWLEGPSAYRGRLDDACIMAFAGTGLMRAADILESLAEAPRWDDVEMRSATIGRGGDWAIVIGYYATGSRRDSDRYTCYCTSTYRRDGDRWLLLQHQQTPD
jgi:hypothetical protein